MIYEKRDSARTATLYRPREAAFPIEMEHTHPVAAQRGSSIHPGMDWNILAGKMRVKLTQSVWLGYSIVEFGKKVRGRKKCVELTKTSKESAHLSIRWRSSSLLIA